MLLVVGSLLAFYFLNPIKTEQVSLLWKYKTESSIFSSPTVYKGRIYVGSCDKWFYVLNASNGELIWKFKTGNYISSSSPYIWSDKVYFSSFDTYLYSLNVDTGNLMWKFKTESVIESSPIVYQGIVYFGSDDNRVYALNASTGELEWKHVATSPYSAEGATSVLVTGAPSVYDGIVYIDSIYRGHTFVNGSAEYKTGGCMHALNATTGELIWRFDVGGEANTERPQVYDGIVYFGSADNNTYAVNAKTGEKVWSYTTNGQVMPGAP